MGLRKNSKKNLYQDRARGMLVGLAVGDALGAPVEFLPEPADFYIKEMGEKIEHFHENYRVPEGVWTDDTEMALCIADSLLVRGGYDSYDIMRKFTAWVNEGYRTYDDKPAMDVGAQTMRAVEDFENYPVVYEDPPKTESAGNGAIMRLAPIIIANISSNKEQSILKMAELSCRETHDSVAAIAVTRLFAAALYCAMQGFEKDEIVEHCAKLKSQNKEYAEFYEKHADSLIGRALEKDDLKFCNLGGYIVDAFAIALWGLLHFDNFKDGMMAVIRLGGDADTNGAIYGQLAGAYYGYKKIPKEWREEVYQAKELVKIADDLLGMSECPIIRTRFEGEVGFGEGGGFYFA